MRLDHVGTVVCPALRFQVGSQFGEDNADAHLRRQIMGREVVLALSNGKLDLGPWEQISTANSTAGTATVLWLR